MILYIQKTRNCVHFLHIKFGGTKTLSSTHKWRALLSVVIVCEWSKEHNKRHAIGCYSDFTKNFNDNKTECWNKGKNFLRPAPGDPSGKSDVEYCRCNIDYCNEGNAESNSNSNSFTINKFVFMISIFFKSVIQN